MKTVSIWANLTIFSILIIVSFGCKKSAQSESIQGEQTTESVSPGLLFQTLPFGDWGSQSQGEPKFLSALFSVSEFGATLDLGCGIGSISKLIVLDQYGSFETEGEFQYQGGAEPVDGFPKFKAFYKGHLDGKKLVLTYRVEGSDTENTIEFIFGQTGNLLRCL